MKNKDLKLNKNIDSELFKVNKNEYFVQQTSNLKAALEMGLTKEEFEFTLELFELSNHLVKAKLLIKK